MRALVLTVLTVALLASVASPAPGFAQTPTPLPTAVGVTVTSVNPTSGSAVSPTPITVTGTGFTAGMTVLLDTRPLQTQFVDATTLRANVPVGLPIGPYAVSVSTPAGTAAAPLPGGYSVFGLGYVLYVPIAVKNSAGDDSGIQVQNTSTTPATVYLIYYDQGGTPIVANGPQGVPGGGSWTFYQPAEAGLPVGFDGSAVVHATQPIAAIVNRVNYTGTLASAGSLTVPSATPATTSVVPLIYGGLAGYSTTLSIQNTGVAVGTYTLNLQPNSFASPIATVQVLVPPMAVRRIRVGTDIAVPPNFIGTAIISSASTPLVAVAETLQASTGILLSYAGASTGATVMNAPLVYKNYTGWASGAQVANMTNSTVTVNASLRNRDNGIAFGLPPITLGPNQGYFYDLGSLGAIPDGFVGSGVFTASGPIALTVQEINAERSTGMAYAGFSAGTTNVSVPLTFKGANGWDTGVQVQNLGSVDTVVTITHFVPSGFSISETDTVIAGNSVTFYQPANPALPAGLTGSAIVTSSGQPIVAIVNEVNYIRGGDSAMAYEGINY